jgi:dCTP deaminase
VTPLEPGWEGQVTLEISNTTPLPAKVYANEGIAQFLFYRGETPCEVTYADRAGKYMGQKGVTLPRLKKSVDTESSEKIDTALFASNQELNKAS